MTRWKILERCKSIEWTVKDSHQDDIEMSGFGVSYTVKYGADENGALTLVHHPVYPSLRKRPNDTHASYQMDVPESLVPALYINGKKAEEKLRRVVINGVLNLYAEAEGVKITHVCYPSATLRAAYEYVTVENVSGGDITLSVDKSGTVEVDQTRGVMGICIMELHCTFGGEQTLRAGEKLSYANVITGRLANEEADYASPEEELNARFAQVEKLSSPMRLDTGCDVLDTMFSFAKLRAGESVFDTMYGLIHSPGGYSYYAATWCNDQVEYSGPWFAYTGDEDLIEAGYNAYTMYTPFMSDRYEPIPSSVIAEGVDYWDGAGDRGDAAMYLYGASHFALTCGDRDMALSLWNGIKWCAEYCRRQMNEEGVISSRSDELEGRFPAGTANLCTSTLCYSGLRSAAVLANEFDETELASEYNKRADALHEAINSYFAAELHGFKTYKYYKENDILRSWICMPLCVNILERAEDTVKALLSEYLMTDNGLLTAEGSVTVWDRSTLYGLKGIFAAGYTGEAAEALMHYSENRLLGERVPYAVEAYPEGGRRHLSGESALYCKIFNEGILSMIPSGFNSFTIMPTLPDGLDHFYMRNIKAYGGIFDVLLDKDSYRVVRSNGDILLQSDYGERKTVTI